MSQNARLQEIKAEAVRLHPDPIYCNSNDPDYYKILLGKVKHKRGLYVIRNKHSKVTSRQ